MLSGKDFIFTSYCFGDQYLEQQYRLKESILNIYPDASLHFINESEETGKPKFQQSLYGFKVHMVQQCLDKGFQKIIFFDTAICLENKVDDWFALAKETGVVAAVDRQTLDNVTSDICLKTLGITRQEAGEWNLVGGSIYVFDFDTYLCNQIFNLWQDMEKMGLFGKQDDLSHDRLQGHRMDETCMALAMAHHDVKPFGHDLMRYAYEHPETKEIHGAGYNPIVIKRHFK